MNYSIFRPVCVLLLLPGTRVVVAAELKSPDGKIVATVDTNREGVSVTRLPTEAERSWANRACG